MLKNSRMQAWKHLMLRLPYSKRAHSYRLLLLLCLIAYIPSLFIPQFISSAANLILHSYGDRKSKLLHGAQISLHATEKIDIL